MISLSMIGMYPPAPGTPKTAIGQSMAVQSGGEHCRLGCHTGMNFATIDRQWYVEGGNCIWHIEYYGEPGVYNAL